MERAEKAEVVGQALAWPVIREADPALSSHSAKQSKQEFTIAGLSAPFTYSFPTSIQLSGRMCPELLQAISLLQHMAFTPISTQESGAIAKVKNGVKENNHPEQQHQRILGDGVAQLSYLIQMYHR